MLVFRTEVKQSVEIMQRRRIVLGGGEEFGDPKSNLSFPYNDHSFGNFSGLIIHHSHTEIGTGPCMNRCLLLLI